MSGTDIADMVAPYACPTPSPGAIPAAGTCLRCTYAMSGSEIAYGAGAGTGVPRGHPRVCRVSPYVLAMECPLGLRACYAVSGTGRGSSYALPRPCPVLTSAQATAMEDARENGGQGISYALVMRCPHWLRTVHENGFHPLVVRVGTLVPGKGAARSEATEKLHAFQSCRCRVWVQGLGRCDQSSVSKISAVGLRGRSSGFKCRGWGSGSRSSI
eukprot:2416066-Rhodomonas_salina.3